MADSTALALVPQPARAALAPAAARAQDYFRAAQAHNTRRAYASDWKHFSAWCRAAAAGSLPATPETVVLDLSTLAETAKVSTLTRRISAISQAHHGAGALLLGGLAGPARPCELVGLDVTGLEFNGAGLIVNIRRSKTDQEGQGRRVGIPYGSNPATCPVRALEGWLAILGADEGPVFRAINRHGQLAGRRLTAQSVALVIKRLAAAAGMETKDLAGHSLRAGLATAAAAAGVSERAIMAQTGHRSLATLRKYIREGSLFLENAAARVGL